MRIISLRWICLLAWVIGANAQKTTDFTGSFVVVPAGPDTERQTISSVGNGQLDGMGEAALRLRIVQQPGRDFWGIGAGKATLSVAMNRADAFEINLDFPDPGATFQYGGSGTISGGRGVYAGATGTANVRFPVPDLRNQLLMSLSMSGTLSVKGQNISLSATNVEMAASRSVYTGTTNLNPSVGTLGPLGNTTLTVVGVDDDRGGTQLTSTFRFNAADSFQILTNYRGGTPSTFTESIMNGTGAYDGATGTIRAQLGPGAGGIGVSFTGQVTQPAAGAPIIRGVSTTASDGPLASNTWTEIQGVNLTPKDTPGGGVFWSNAPEFAGGKMPTQLGPISVTMGGKPTYIWWYCSAATTPGCARDQINVLTPPDTGTGLIPVVVKIGNVSSAPFYVERSGAISPTLLLAQAKGYALSTHVDGTLVGPTTLYPGATTPARKRETVILWGSGFGLPTAGVVTGSSTQSALLPQNIRCYIGTFRQQVQAALASPGLTQLNLTIPPDISSGDHLLTCVSDVNGNTPIGTLITVE